MKDLFSVEGKIALVTGGSRGIGEMIASGFLASGAKVYISSRKADACEATAKRLMENTGGDCIPLPADVSDLGSIEALASALAERGRECLDAAEIGDVGRERSAFAAGVLHQSFRRRLAGVGL
ncbi:MAG: SDR family NAD(P)-dependent oxidoreductase, partial [Myxococcota bacterium]